MNACRRMLVLTSAVLCLGATWATDGVWSNLTTGLWSDPANWRNGSVGGGAGASVVIAPGFGGERPENRMMEIPGAGVTLGSLVYEAGDPMGAIRIWGGPLTFDGNGGEARIRGCVDPATGGLALNVLTEVHATGDLHLESVTLGSIAHHTGDTYLDSGTLNLYFVCSADRPSAAATNYLPATSLHMGPGTGIYAVSRGSSGAYSATFTLTEGSDLVTTTVNANRCIGAPVTGDGIPEGTFVKCAITEYHIQISQPATKSGDSLLTVGEIPSGQISLQQFQKLIVNGSATLDQQSHQGSVMRFEVGELTGAGTLNKYSNGELALGVGANYVGALNVSGGTVELAALPGTDPAFTHLQLDGCTFNLTNPDAIVSADVLEGGEGRVVKTGPGTLQVGRLAAGTGQMQLEVKEGAVEIGHGGGVSACPVKGAWLHVDAMARDSMTIVEENGTNFVTRWNDCDGGANYAEVNSALHNGARPWISTNFCGGLPVLDFGTLHYQENGVVQKEGYGASMDWNARDGQIREVFLVCADTEEPLDSDNRTRQFLLGDSDGYAFHRGFGENLFIQYTDGKIRNGLIEVDGTVVPPADCERYELAVGFHLIHLRTTGNVAAGAFARNRGLGFGGLRLAEVLVFNKELKVDEATAVANYLNGKWFGANPPHAIAELTIDGDADVTVEADDVLSVGTLTIAGDVVKKGGGALCVEKLVKKDGGTLRVEEGTLQSGTNTVIRLDGLDVQSGAGAGARAGSTLSVGIVEGSGAFVKDGAGTVQVGGFDGVTKTEVRDGTLAMPGGSLPGGTWLHVDASRPETMDTVVEGGKTYVTKWYDCDGNGRSATTDTANRPYLSTGYLPGGSVVDFGSYHYPDNNGGPTVQGYGASMVWNEADTGIREVFMVYSDTEDLADCPATLTANFLLGDNGDFKFHRGLETRLFIDPYADATIRGGLVEVDGVPCGIDYQLPSGFHVIHLRTTGGVRANAFARNRGLGFGGQRLAEVVIYNEPLLDEDAESAKNYLFAKWWGNGAARVYDELSVAAGATLDCSGANVVAATLACAGTIRADRLAVGTLALESDGTGVTSFVLEGNFDGTTPGIAFVDGVELPRNGSAVYRVANVAGCLGDASLRGWKVVGPALPKGWSGRLFVQDGQLLLQLNPAGSEIILR